MSIKNLENLEATEQLSHLVRNGIMVALRHLTLAVREVEAAAHRLEETEKGLNVLAKLKHKERIL